MNVHVNLVISFSLLICGGNHTPSGIRSKQNMEHLLQCSFRQSLRANRQNQVLTLNLTLRGDLNLPMEVSRCGSDSGCRTEPIFLELFHGSETRMAAIFQNAASMPDNRRQLITQELMSKFSVPGNRISVHRFGTEKIFAASTSGSTPAKIVGSGNGQRCKISPNFTMKLFKTSLMGLSGVFVQFFSS